MPKHKTILKNLFEKIDANSVMVNKWAVLGVDANAVYCTLCLKPVPINHGGMEQVNHHVRGKTHKSFSDAKFQSETSEKFTIGCTKMSYVVCHGLGPVVLEEISKDINTSVGCITLLLDETTTAQVKKQCNFLIRY